MMDKLYNSNLIIEYAQIHNQLQIYVDMLWTHTLFMYTQIHNQSQIYVGFGNQENGNDVTFKILKQSKLEYDLQTIKATYSTANGALNEIQSVGISYFDFSKMNIWFRKISGLIGIINYAYDIIIKSLFISDIDSVIYTDSYSSNLTTIKNKTILSIPTPTPTIDTIDTNPFISIAVHLNIINSTENITNVIRNITSEIINGDIMPEISV
eukprot:126638_1